MVGSVSLPLVMSRGKPTLNDGITRREHPLALAVTSSQSPLRGCLHSGRQFAPAHTAGGVQAVWVDVGHAGTISDTNKTDKIK